MVVRNKIILSSKFSGELRLQAFGVTEPNSGSDTLSLNTSAVFDGRNQ